MFSSYRKGIRLSVVSVSLVFLAGCGGLSIDPGKDPKKGYTVYAPMVMVNVSRVRTCEKLRRDGTCEQGQSDSCVVGTPYVLPDYTKPFTVKFEKGLGSYSGSVTIENGWMLGAATSTGDPSDFLTNVGEAAAVMATSVTCTEGIYKLGSDGKFAKFDTLPGR